ncbi:exonuclease subunit SbcD [Cryobacterium melibiosiphilum]|uniref:Nuclease SbcCD subunit D n=1 Tax=Cryobacterium melibiosiphilum TaxID=995039 RepID=A0A3A5MRK7_9MICO|nr:exonuclease SbcCD subunit D C-terminal domain-containing protein [Cryobacterium melibiosiphilum]RJT88636.1 exonuclease subunit SbcD [Cryobacterium melibiosiphilum]RJT89398.1 exonuclease subunit SbcD [Cryobacterium melibiosiphilum]
MKILHTSDWHIGRTFHTHPTLDHLGTVLTALVTVVRDRGVDVVVVAGDIFDSAMPSKDSLSVLTTVLRQLKDAGAVVVMTSGNHDSAARLGFQSEWARLAGIHIITGPSEYLEPVTVEDSHGPVHFYGIPYLEPVIVRHHLRALQSPESGDVELKTHEQVLGFVMGQVRADAAARGGRSVVLAHCFAAGIKPAAEASEVERDITAGGLDVVSTSVFDGPDYVALGHIHGRATLSNRVRYSGAPLHYSFSEAGKPRGAWLVELGTVDADPIVEWVDLPVPRRLSEITGTLEELLGDARFLENAGDWVKAVLTDQVRPLDGMRQLHERFPFCVALEHRPTVVVALEASTYRERVRAKSDPDIVAGFLEYVRNGVGPTEFEVALIAELLTQQASIESDGAVVRP